MLNGVSLVMGARGSASVKHSVLAAIADRVTADESTCAHESESRKRARTAPSAQSLSMDSSSRAAGTRPKSASSARASPHAGSARTLAAPSRSSVSTAGMSKNAVLALALSRARTLPKPGASVLGAAGTKRRADESAPVHPAPRTRGAPVAAAETHTPGNRSVHILVIDEIDALVAGVGLPAAGGAWARDSFTNATRAKAVRGESDASVASTLARLWDRATSAHPDVLSILFAWPHTPGSRVVLIGIANAVALADRCVRQWNAHSRAAHGAVHA